MPSGVYRRKQASRFAAMSRAQLLEHCRALYAESGLLALSYNTLSKERGLYTRLFEVGLPVRVLLRELGISAEYRKAAHATFDRNRNGKILEKWTWERIAAVCREVVTRENFLPPAAWFQRHGYGALVASVYNLGFTWADLRMHFESYSKSIYIVSRAGLHWRSRAEASLSNFLYARCVEHQHGSYYPPEYALEAGRKYGKYDLGFRDDRGRLIEVEVWGDKPNGRDAAGYAEKRAAKERFNARVLGDRFLGIGFMDCYDEEKLRTVLAPLIGNLRPTRFDKDTDRKIASVHWSDADDLIAFCRELASQQPDGVFPTEEWLRKRGKWQSREGPPYNGASWNIQHWLGGIRVLRELIGQPHNSTVKWTRASVIAAYKGWFSRHAVTPGQARYYADQGRLDLRPDEYRFARRLSAAVVNHLGSVRALHQLLGLPPPRSSRPVFARAI